MPRVYIAALPNSPLGRIWTAVSSNGLIGVDLWDDRARFEARVEAMTAASLHDDSGISAPYLGQLREYLDGRRQTFDLRVDWSNMTRFQRAVLQLVAAIPYGQTRTYGQIAAELGKPNAVRAVGRANATNPMPLVIPCHRILGADGRLHGYSAPGGLETKAWLLRREGAWLI